MSDKTNEKSVAVKGGANDNRVKIAIIITVVALVLVGAAVALTLILTHEPDPEPGPEDTPNTGETLDGTYGINPETQGFASSSTWTFKGNKVTNVYYTTEAGEVTIEYTYVIAIEEGVKVIKLTTTDEDGNLKTTTHTFAEGTYLNGKPMVIINDVWYVKSE